MNALMTTIANRLPVVHAANWLKVLVAKQQSTSDLLPGKCELITHLRLVYKHKVESLVL